MTVFYLIVFVIGCIAGTALYLALKLVLTPKDAPLLQGIPGPAGPAGPAGPQGAPGIPGKDALLPPHLMYEPAPPPGAHGISRIERWNGQQWVPGEHVRQNTPAWQKAWDEPGVRLVDEQGDIQLGTQS